MQQWTPEEVQAYCVEKFELKRPAYVKKAEQEDALHFSKNSKRKKNDLCLARPSKQQYERFFKQGLTAENIINRYRHLPIGWLKNAKKAMGVCIKKQPEKLWLRDLVCRLMYNRSFFDREAEYE